MTASPQEIRPLRILHTCFSASWGGLEIYALDVAARFADAGHRVCLACLPASRLAQEAAARGVHTLPIGMRGYLHPLLTVRLSRAIRTGGFDLVHCHLSRDIATVIPARQLARTPAPVVLTKSVGSYLSKKDPLHRYTYGHLARVLAISSVIRRNILDTTPMSPDRVQTLHFPVDTERFDTAKTDRERTRRELGFAASEVVVGFVGRFSPGKGHEELIKAATVLCERHANIRFLVVGEPSHGEDEYARTIRLAASTLTAAGKLRFAGFRKDVPQVMAAFDMLAFPSHAEAFGMVLIEAMAMELPVVATSSDGVLDIVVEEETGLLVPRGNAEALAAALERLIADPGLRRRLGESGRRRAVAAFDIRQHIQLLEDIYRRVIGETKEPRSRPDRSGSRGAGSRFQQGAM